MWYNGLKVDATKVTPSRSCNSTCEYVYFRLKMARASSGSPVSLTPCKIYRATKYESGYIFVTNDKGQLRQYNTNDFGILPDNIIDVLDKESLRETQIKRLLR